RAGCLSRGRRITAVTFTTTKHLHLIGHNVCGITILPGFLVLPLASLQASFDVNRTTLFQVFASNLGKSVVEHNTVPLGFFALFTRCLVLPLRGGCNGYIADRSTIRGI